MSAAWATRFSSLLSSYDKLPAPGETVHILTHLHVREDAQILYGFMTAAERESFRPLVNHVSGSARSSPSPCSAE